MRDKLRKELNMAVANSSSEMAISTQAATLTVDLKASVSIDGRLIIPCSKATLKTDWDMAKAYGLLVVINTRVNTWMTRSAAKVNSGGQITMSI
jgi:hypothetical protein